MGKIQRIPISVIYKKPRGKKAYVETFDNVRSVDDVILEKSKLLPKGSDLLEVGVGEKFSKRFIQQAKKLNRNKKKR